MNERYKMAFGSAAIGAAFFALLTFLQFLFAHQPNTHDVNPIGFHAQGQVLQIGTDGGGSNLKIESCAENNPCKLRFDFSTDYNSAALVPVTCAGYVSCLAFSGDSVNLSYPFDPLAKPYKLNGRIVKVDKKDNAKGDTSGLGFHANGEMRVKVNSLNLDVCTTSASCSLRFDFSTNSTSEFYAFTCENYQNCMLFHDAWSDVADGPAQQLFTDRINGRIVLNP